MTVVSEISYPRLTEWFMNLSQLLSENMSVIAPAVVGLGVGLIVILMFSRGKKKSQREEFSRTSSNNRSSQWITQTASLSERRNSVRREGAPVKVILSSPAFRNGTMSGYVTDRSTGGLRVVMEGGVAPGSTIMIRANHAPESTPWVTIIVRSCKDQGEHYELGCEFEKTPPWNVLLLFG
jgi:hypothetical protein